MEIIGNGNLLFATKYSAITAKGMDARVIYQPASGPHLVTDLTGPPSKTEIVDVEKSLQGPSEHTV